MEELSESLRKALEKEQPLRLRDPHTDRVYVLIQAEEFDRLSQEEGLPPAVARSKRAFLRDLPSLLQDGKNDRWCVAYAGDERVGIAQSEADLVRECQRRGLKRDQYFLGVVAPQDPGIEDVDPSPHEYE
jgi:hypothetical protein